MPRSITEIEQEIATLQASRSSLVLVPLKGAVGKTNIDLTENVKLMDRRLSELNIELGAARNPHGIAQRPGWGRCCP